MFEGYLTGRSNILSNISKFVATLGYAGFVPYAPGTVGSALGFLLVFIIGPGDLHLFLICAALFAAGVFTSGKAEKELGKDSGHIVIDEFCGSLLTVVLVPRDPQHLIAAFVLFRFFDIVKPYPIKKVERLVPGGAGVMIDDILAAVYGNFCIQVWVLIAPAFS